MVTTNDKSNVLFYDELKCSECRSIIADIAEEDIITSFVQDTNSMKVKFHFICPACLRTSKIQLGNISNVQRERILCRNLGVGRRVKATPIKGPYR